MDTKYYIKADGDSILVGVPISNNTTIGSGPVSVVFGAFGSNLTLSSTYKDVGTYTTLTRTWDNFTLKPGETQTIYLKFVVTDVDLLPATITGTITNAVDGNDGAGTAISITLYNDESVARKKVYKILLDQAGTADPTAIVLLNELSAAVVWARSSAGVYTATLASAFTTDKTFFIVQAVGSPTAVSHVLTHTSANVLTLTTFDAVPAAADLVGRLNILVEVYP